MKGVPGPSQALWRAALHLALPNLHLPLLVPGGSLTSFYSDWKPQLPGTPPPSQIHHTLCVCVCVCVCVRARVYACPALAALSISP